jgi:hypothetical protein
MRALLCYCRQHLEARDDEALGAVVREHLIHKHPALDLSDEQVEGIVSTRAYDLEYVEVDAYEEPGFDPY